jgi:transcriptional regulator with XRE-family HTH domain
MNPTQKDLAARLGVTAGRVSQLKKAGMPTDSIEAAEAWLALNVSRDKPRDIELPEGSLPEDMGPKARLQRAQEGERQHFALWQAAVARQPANTREIAELATSWSAMRKGASEAEKEYAAFLLQIGTTINKPQAIRAIRGLFAAIVQDFSTHPWGNDATRIVRHHLETLPPSLRD